MTSTGQGIVKWLFSASSTSSSSPSDTLSWAAYIGLFYIIVDVGVGKGAVLFLGWMVGIMQVWSPAVVVFAFVLLGKAVQVDIRLTLG